jgi:lipoate-protein ligase A
MPLPSFGEGRLLWDPPLPGAWNMGVDEVLLENADAGQLTLRFYAWQPTTVSLGYFQPAESRLSHAGSRDCPFVRRPSGGGALVHDDDQHELTYSVAVPGVLRSRSIQSALYDTFHHSLIRALAHLGVSAHRCGGNAQSAESTPFLCFQRRAPGDVLVGRWKVGGSAQRRLATAILQHGSVLLSQSAAAPELPGTTQLSNTRLSASELGKAWLAALHDFWPVSWQPGALTPAERHRAARKVQDKYGHSNWNQRL